MNICRDRKTSPFMALLPFWWNRSFPIPINITWKQFKIQKPLWTVHLYGSALPV